MLTYNLADLLEQVGRKAPDRLAVVGGNDRLTYGRLDDRAGRIGGHLAAAGIQPGQTVAILAWNRSEWLESMFGCFKIGAIPIGVNYRYVDREAAFVLGEAGCVAVVVEAEFLPMLDRIRPDLPELRHVVVLDGEHPRGQSYERALEAASPASRPDARSGDALYVIHTGGTTGLPKGVVWRHEDFFFSGLGGGNYAGPPIARPEDIGVYLAGPPLPTLVTSALMHGNGQAHALGALLEGRTAVLWTGRHFDPPAVAELAQREAVAVLVLTGDAMARPFADYLAANRGVHDLSSIQVISSGAMALSANVKDGLNELLPGCQVADVFGASESGVLGRRVDGEGPDHALRFRMPDDVRVLGPDLRPVAPGQTGFIARRGRLPLGYLNDPAKTAATFRIDSDGVRWAVLGDQARLEADGVITVLGRGSTCINTGGEKVFPEEVELATKTHPAISDAIIVGLPDDRFGERVAALVAFAGEPVTLEDLQTHLRTRLAGYKLPRQLITVDRIRYTPTGKPDYGWARDVAMSA